MLTPGKRPTGSALLMMSAAIASDRDLAGLKFNNKGQVCID